MKWPSSQLASCAEFRRRSRESRGLLIEAYGACRLCTSRVHSTSRCSRKNGEGGGGTHTRDWDINCKIYVGRLRQQTNEYDIRNAFNRYRQVKNIWVVRSPPGHAFVEMRNQGDAKGAVRGLNGTRVAGTEVRVRKGLDRVDWTRPNIKVSSDVYDYGMMFPESLKVEEDEPRAPPGGTRSMGAGLISTDAKIAEKGPDGLPEIEQVDLHGKGDGIARGIWKLSNRQGDREELTPHHTKGRADGKLLLTARTSDAEARKSPESSQVTSIRVKLKTSVGGAMAKTLALREAPKKGGCNALASKGNKEKENGGGRLRGDRRMWRAYGVA